MVQFPTLTRLRADNLLTCISFRYDTFWVRTEGLVEPVYPAIRISFSRSVYNSGIN